MSCINDNIFRELCAGDLGNDVLGFCFAFILLECELNLFGLGCNKTKTVGDSHAYAGDNTLICVDGAEHTLVKVCFALFVCECAACCDKCKRTCFDELFVVFNADAAGNENDLSFYICKAHGVEGFKVAEFSFDAVLRSVAGKTVAGYFVFASFGFCYLKFNFFDFVARSHKCFDLRLNTCFSYFVCDYSSCAFFSFRCRKTHEVEFFQERIHSLSADFHLKISFQFAGMNLFLLLNSKKLY